MAKLKTTISQSFKTSKGLHARKENGNVVQKRTKVLTKVVTNEKPNLPKQNGHLNPLPTTPPGRPTSISPYVPKSIKNKRKLSQRTPIKSTPNKLKCQKTLEFSKDKLAAKSLVLSTPPKSKNVRTNLIFWNESPKSSRFSQKDVGSYIPFVKQDREISEVIRPNYEQLINQFTDDKSKTRSDDGDSVISRARKMARYSEVSTKAVISFTQLVKKSRSKSFPPEWLDDDEEFMKLTQEVEKKYCSLPTNNDISPSTSGILGQVPGVETKQELSANSKSSDSSKSPVVPNATESDPNILSGCRRSSQLPLTGKPLPTTNSPKISRDPPDTQPLLPVEVINWPNEEEFNDSISDDMLIKVIEDVENSFNNSNPNCDLAHDTGDKTGVMKMPNSNHKHELDAKTNQSVEMPRLIAMTTGNSVPKNVGNSLKSQVSKSPNTVEINVDNKKQTQIDAKFTVTKPKQTIISTNKAISKFVGISKVKDANDNKFVTSVDVGCLEQENDIEILRSSKLPIANHFSGSKDSVSKVATAQNRNTSLLTGKPVLNRIDAVNTSKSFGKEVSSTRKPLTKANQLVSNNLSSERSFMGTANLRSVKNQNTVIGSSTVKNNSSSTVKNNCTVIGSSSMKNRSIVNGSSSVKNHSTVTNNSCVKNHVITNSTSNYTSTANSKSSNHQTTSTAPLATNIVSKTNESRNCGVSKDNIPMCSQSVRSKHSPHCSGAGVANVACSRSSNADTDWPDEDLFSNFALLDSLSQQCTTTPVQVSQEKKDVGICSAEEIARKKEAAKAKLRMKKARTLLKLNQR